MTADGVNQQTNGTEENIKIRREYEGAAPGSSRIQMLTRVDSRKHQEHGMWRKQRIPDTTTNRRQLQWGDKSIRHAKNATVNTELR